MSDRPLEVFAHERAFGEHAGQQEREEHGEPAADRKARLEMERMRWRRNSLGDRADDEAEKLQREQHPGDLLQTERVRGDERVARAHRLDDRQQPPEDGMIERKRGQTEHGDCAQAHDEPLRIRRRREFESGHDPLLVWHDKQQSEDHGGHQPVQEDKDPQHDVSDRQGGG